MGFNPHQPQQRTKWDYLFVAAGLLVCVAVVVWAAMG